jgi:hypothetical protein
MRAALAYDRASVRHTDLDGRLHVGCAVISMACVSPYRGSEVPSYEALGLDAGKIYRVFRDPAELAKAVATFNGLPLLSQHVPVDAVDHRGDLVVGALGDSAHFDGSLLTNSLVVWVQDSIDSVIDGTRSSISAGYRYRAVPERGVFRGEPYDLRMVDICANHAALVEDGRIGAVAVIGDSALPTPHVIARPHSDVIRARYWGSYAF